MCGACPILRCRTDYEEVQHGDGKVLIHRLVDRNASDYRKVYSVAEEFAKRGSVVEMLPKIHTKAPLYKKIYGDLIGTKYDSRCPDLKIDGKYYEHEGFTSATPKNAFRNMLKNGLTQSSRLVIEQVDLTDAFMKMSIKNRIYNYHQDIDEVWIRGINGIRLLFKNKRNE